MLIGRIDTNWQIFINSEEQEYIDFLVEEMAQGIMHEFLARQNGYEIG